GWFGLRRHGHTRADRQRPGRHRYGGGPADQRRAVAAGGHPEQPHRRDGGLGRYRRRGHGERRLEHRDHHDRGHQVLRGAGDARQLTDPFGQSRPILYGRGGRRRAHLQRHGVPG